MSLLPGTVSAENLFTDKETIFSKSSAQVETRVGPRDVAPPLSCGLKPKRKRASPVKVRLDETEKEVVQRKARRAGLSINAFIKQVILDEDYDPILRRTLLALNREFTRQGSNLNQIAKYHNTGSITQIEGESMLAILARSHLQTHRQIREALAKGDLEEPTP